VNRIDAKFEALACGRKKAFIPYLTAGDPDLDTTKSLILEMERSGADIIELGVPFSDPMADGPVIQRASHRALQNGVGVTECLDLARQIRKQSEIPIVLFSYYNPLLAFGLDSLAGELVRAGIDGLLVTDMVPEEADELLALLRPAGIDTIFLVAPTSTDERIRRIANVTTGFIYAVSLRGVTGVRRNLSDAADELVSRVRNFSSLPVAVGFGVSTPDHVRQVWQTADGAVVGSRIVAEIEKYEGRPDLIARVGELTRQLVSGNGATDH
jgi:tryptophan synthase alpha chain